MKTTKKTRNVREVTLDILIQIEKNQAYSNLLLNGAIKQNQVSSKDAGLLTEIVYGTIQRKLTLDYYLRPYLKNPSKIEAWVLVLLRMTLYQMHFLSRVPDRAAIFEAVEIAKNRGHKGISSMVNGVLRSIQRTGVQSIEEKDEILQLSIETSFPVWLVKRWVKQYGYLETKQLCESTLEHPTSSARVNSSILSIDELIKKLDEEGVSSEKGELSADSIIINKGNFVNTNAYQEGFLTIQDESSMLVSRALGIKENDVILDTCAAPGGKTTHIAEILHGSGKVVAVDLHEHKVKLINQQVERLKLTNVETLALDSRTLQDRFEDETFDRILVDAPCSGLGVIRRKPDLKYQKQEKDIAALASIQSTILNAVVPLLKKGGTLVYSTCTMDKEENDDVVEKFLASHPTFERCTELFDRLPDQIKDKALYNEGQVQILPHHFGTDGFFIACMRKQV